MATPGQNVVSKIEPWVTSSREDWNGGEVWSTYPLLEVNEAGGSTPKIGFDSGCTKQGLVLSC